MQPSDPSADLYARLGIGPGADIEEIKAAYWRLATPHHVAFATAPKAPGRRPAGSSSPARQGGEEARAAAPQRELERLDEAYAVLVDRHARLHYHAERAGVDLSRLPDIIGDAVSGLDLEVEVAGLGPGAPRPSCVVCGGTPAAPVILKAVTGTLVRFRVDEVRDALCARCGIATYRDMQARTLVRGWWGLFALLHSWVAVVTNWAMARHIDALPEPARPGRWPDGSPRLPLHPGPPLWRRPRILLAGVLVVALAVAVLVDTFLR